MNTFQSIEELNSAFVKGQLEKLFNEVTIKDVKFQERDRIVPKEFSDLSKGKKIISLYSPLARKSDNRLAFVWGMKSGLNISPLLVKLVGRYRGDNEESVMKEAEGSKEQPEPVIGTHMELVLLSFNDEKPIMGKVDTGATVCSLHAENIEIRNDPYDSESKLVDFEFLGKRYTVGMVQHQSVQSADGGVNYRPVIKFNVKYEGAVYSDVLFNLNDRSEMEDKLLIGMNLLQEIGYKIDPKLENEETDEDVLTEEEITHIEQQIEEDISSLIGSEKTDKVTDDIHIMYEYLLEKNITFADLLKHVKSHTIKIIERLEP